MKNLMPFFACGATIVLVLLCLVSWLRHSRRLRETTPPLRLPPTPEILKCDFLNFLGACLLSILLVALAYAVAGIGPWLAPVGYQYLFPIIGALLALAGAIRYLVCFYRLVRDLWVALHGMEQYRRGKIWGWFVVFLTIIALPIFLIYVTLTLWRSPFGGRMRRYCALFSGLAIVTMIGCLWMPYWGGMLSGVLVAIAFGLITQGAIRHLTGGQRSPALPPAYRRRAWRFGVGLMLLFIPVAGVWAATYIYITIRTARADAKMTALGVPLTPAEWQSQNPSLKNNAYPLYQALETARKPHANLLPETLDPVLSWLFLAPQLPSGAQEALDQWLTANAPVAALLEQLNPEQPIQFPHEWQGYNTFLPELAVLRGLARYQCARIYQTARNDDPVQSLKRLEQLRILRHWSASGGCLISGLVQIAIGAMQFEAVHGVLNTVILSDSDLQMLQGQMAEDEKRQDIDWYQCLKQEAYVCSYSMQPESLLREAVPDHYGLLPAFNANPWLMIGIFRLDRAFMEEYYTDFFLPSAALDYAQTRDEERAMNEKLDQLKPYGILSRMILPALATARMMQSQQIAQFRIVRTALAAELYRRKYGHWPERLTALVPEFLDAVPIDPFDGQPLRMKSGELDAWELNLQSGKPATPELVSVVDAAAFDEDETVAILPPVISTKPPQISLYRDYKPVIRSGFMVYSIGRDLTDNNGTPKQPESKSAMGNDITFSLYQP